MVFHLVMLLSATVMQVLDPELPESWMRNVEAAAKADKEGHPVEAEALLTEVVREAEKLGPDDLHLARPLEILGQFYLDKKHKHYVQALALLRRALSIRLRTQGPDHPDVACTQVTLALCLMVAKEKEAHDAGPMLRRALATLERFKGKDSPEVAEALHALSCWHLVRREYDDASKTLQRAVTIREKAFGSESTKVADFLDDLGDLHTIQANRVEIAQIDAQFNSIKLDVPKPEEHCQQAEAYYKQALAIREEDSQAGRP